MPFVAWQDHTIRNRPSSLFNGEALSEVVIESNYKVDGNIEWRFDQDWLGQGTPGAILSNSVQAMLLANPLTFWAPIFLGDCEKDQPMRVRFRGTLEASENGGVGLRVNENTNCGPNGDGPCTWAYVYPWPARPICNNHIKPKIESNFVEQLVIGMTRLPIHR